MEANEWEVYVVDEVHDWINRLDAASHARVVQAIDLLAEIGPGSGTPGTAKPSPWPRSATRST